MATADSLFQDHRLPRERVKNKNKKEPDMPLGDEDGRVGGGGRNPAPGAKNQKSDPCLLSHLLPHPLSEHVVALEKDVAWRHKPAFLHVAVGKIFAKLRQCLENPGP